MTKTLTEQWRDGKLPEGLYYIEGKGNYDIALIRNRCRPALTSPYCEDDVFEPEFVPVAPVPSYDEIKRLQEQLKEANKLLKYCCANYESSRFGATITEDGEILPKGPVWNYLKKWGVK